MPLSALHVLHVCKEGSENECKYLLQDELDPDVFYCLKLSSQKKFADDNSRIKFFRKDNSKLPNNDNCAGYPILHHLVLGYDQKNT